MWYDDLINDARYNAWLDEEMSRSNPHTKENTNDHTGNHPVSDNVLLCSQGLALGTPASH